MQRDAGSSTAAAERRIFGGPARLKVRQKWQHGGGDKRTASDDEDNDDRDDEDYEDQGNIKRKGKTAN